MGWKYPWKPGATSAVEGGRKAYGRRRETIGTVADGVCVGALREGISFGLLMDPETGVSAHARDFHVTVSPVRKPCNGRL